MLRIVLSLLLLVIVIDGLKFPKYSIRSYTNSNSVGNSYGNSYNSVSYNSNSYTINSNNGNSGNGLPPNSNNKLFLSNNNNDNETDSLNSKDNSVENNDENSNSNNPVIRQWKKLSKDTKEDIKTTFISFLVALLVRLFLFEPRFIPSLSMFPTFDIGDQLLVDKVSSRLNRPYQRRDVVVFNPPDTYIELTGNTEALIKRVVAVAGDTVEIKNNHLYVNDVLQDETYINELPDYSLPPTKVPMGMVLVLGDNRNHSFDSHIWGFLPDRNIIGRAVVKYWPPWRMGLVEGSL